MAPPFLTSALDRDEWSHSRPPVETALGTHCIGGWVGTTNSLDAVEYRKISFLCLESNSGRPAPSLVPIPTALS
jgi:hypothetical protein